MEIYGWRKYRMWVYRSLIAVVVAAGLFWVGTLIQDYFSWNERIQDQVRTAADAWDIHYESMLEHGTINRDSAGNIIAVLGYFKGLYTSHGKTVRLSEQPDGAQCTIAPGGENLFWWGTTYPRSFYCSIPAGKPYNGAAILYFTTEP